MPLAASAVVPWNNQCSLTTWVAKTGKLSQIHAYNLYKLIIIKYHKIYHQVIIKLSKYQKTHTHISLKVGTRSVNSLHIYGTSNIQELFVKGVLCGEVLGWQTRRNVAGDRVVCRWSGVPPTASSQCFCLQLQLHTCQLENCDMKQGLHHSPMFANKTREWRKTPESRFLPYNLATSDGMNTSPWLTSQHQPAISRKRQHGIKSVAGSSDGKADKLPFLMQQVYELPSKHHQNSRKQNQAPQPMQNCIPPCHTMSIKFSHFILSQIIISVASSR